MANHGQSWLIMINDRDTNQQQWVNSYSMGWLRESTWQTRVLTTNYRVSCRFPHHFCDSPLKLQGGYIFTKDLEAMDSFDGQPMVYRGVGILWVLGLGRMGGPVASLGGQAVFKDLGVSAGDPASCNPRQSSRCMDETGEPTSLQVVFSVR